MTLEDQYDYVRSAWSAKPDTQSCCMFDRATAQRLKLSASTVQRRRIKLGLVAEARAPLAHTSLERKLEKFSDEDLRAELCRRSTRKLRQGRTR